MISFEAVIVPLSTALGLSLIVERVLEFLKNILGAPLTRNEGRQIPPIKTVKKIVSELEQTYRNDRASLEIEEKAEKAKRDKLRAKLEKESDPAKRRELRKQLEELEKDGEWDERVSSATILVEPASDPDDGTTIKAFILQLLGFALGILLARSANLQLFHSFLTDSQAFPVWADYLLTGLLIGGGSGPVHVLIRFITQRKVSDAGIGSAETEEEPATVSQPKTPAVLSEAPAVPRDEWIEIPYSGGVDREKLQWIHKRPADPNLIVYHHTTLNRKSTFEDVVRVIKNRTDSKGNHWVTGYHCVITADGGIHPFCRWDRYGNHAVGYNRRSLGISFNGNFETNPRIPFSNPEGKMGPPRPTEVQLQAGARVVTLWSFLYGIEIDFEKNIIPHHQIASKACPGSNFPYDEFKRWIEFYRQKWEKSDLAQEKIEAFKLKPYLYV